MCKVNLESFLSALITHGGNVTIHVNDAVGEGLAVPGAFLERELVVVVALFGGLTRSASRLVLDTVHDDPLESAMVNLAVLQFFRIKLRNDIDDVRSTEARLADNVTCHSSRVTFRQVLGDLLDLLLISQHAGIKLCQLLRNSVLVDLFFELGSEQFTLALLHYFSEEGARASFYYVFVASGAVHTCKLLFHEHAVEAKLVGHDGPAGAVLGLFAHLEGSHSLNL